MLTGFIQPADRDHLERHFPLLIPPLLTLIDDEDLAFKTRGCNLLSQLLEPIRESQSNILQRTNLSSVFEDALKQCFFSLPSITPEEDCIRLLSAAYPALLSILKTAYQSPSSTTTKRPQDQELYITGITKILRDHIIPSFHHISSTGTTSGSSFATFPYPRLSTFLLNQLSSVLPELGIHTTKYLQEIIPALYNTLANPFGPTDVNLLRSSVAATRAVILNVHPRLWRWRTEILGGVCSCWLNIVEEERQIAEQISKGGLSSGVENGPKVELLKKELEGVVYLLRVALENPTDEEVDMGQREAKENIGRELQDLVHADDALEKLLLADIDPDDGAYFDKFS